MLKESKRNQKDRDRERKRKREKEKEREGERARERERERETVCVTNRPAEAELGDSIITEDVSDESKALFNVKSLG